MNGHYAILHSIPGRIRLSLDIGEMMPAEAEARLRTIPCVYSAVYSALTKTVVLHHQNIRSHGKLSSYIASLFPTKKESVKEQENEIPLKSQVKDLAIVLGAWLAEKAMTFTVFPFTIHPIITPVTLATLYASRHIIKNGLRTFYKPNPDTLTTAALVASILKGTPQSALVIYAMSTVSEMLTAYTMNRTRGYVRDIMQVDTSHAWLVSDDGEVKVPVETVCAGNEIMVFQGEKIPFDGRVASFYAQVDQSSITGEYNPVNVCEGTYVYAGSIVTEGKLLIKVERTGEDMAVNRMIKLIEEAQNKQAPIQTMTEKFTNRMVPISFILAGTIYLATRDWNRVLNMLVIDYVCGVKLSTAAAISAAIGKAAKSGVLLKGGQTIETLAAVDTVVFDKTGTITEGSPAVTDVTPFNHYTEEEVLGLAASAEEHASHPLAEAILRETIERGIFVPAHEDESVEIHTGKGVSVLIDGEHVLVGSRRFLEEHGVLIQGDQSAGIFVSKEGELVGTIDVRDKIRKGMNRSINRLRRDGVDECIMLTGDHEDAAKEIASLTVIDDYIAGAMPEDKAMFIQALKKEEDRTVMMVGDGINDAPALAYADIGVTLGAKKTDIAMETADMVVHSDNPLLLSRTLSLSKKTMKIIRQNILVSLIVNTGAIVLGTLGVIRPITGAAIHNAATIGVVLNSLNLIMARREPNVIHNQDSSLHTRKNPIIHSGTVENQPALSY
ncbi:heavy metal translocating P-type ATPase [Pradoshia sp.]